MTEQVQNKLEANRHFAALLDKERRGWFHPTAN